VLRAGGTAVLVIPAARALPARHRASGQHPQQSNQAHTERRRRGGWRAGLITSLPNPKRAAFFVGLFPPFLTRGSPLLPYPLAMAATAVAPDLVWFSALTYTADQARTILQPPVQHPMEPVTGAVMIGPGIRPAMKSR
jgi:threonine/homoserine/homoserine lactone efflux protein